MHQWLLLLSVLGVRVSFCKIVGLAVRVSDVAELCLVPRRPSHDSTHFEKLVVALPELSLLPSDFLLENIRIDDFLNFFLRFLIVCD
jgi:hypothetical protein